MNSSVNNDAKTNQVTLANATELAARVIMKVAGNEIANTIDGQQVTPSGLADTVNARFQSNLAKHLENV